MANFTNTNSQTRTYHATGITKAEWNAVMEAGLMAVFGPGGTGDLPADFALDADDTAIAKLPGTAGTPVIWNRQATDNVELSINETD